MQEMNHIYKKIGLFLLIILTTVIFTGCQRDGGLISSLVVTPKPDIYDFETEMPTQKPTATPVPASTPTMEPTPTPTLKNDKIVAIDAGHQGRGNNDQEPIGPGASETKAKVTSGTYGNYSGLAEHELNLIVARKLCDILEERGYQVVMIRDTHDIDISNRERADVANNSGADIFVRIHADSSENTSASGASTLYPGRSNPYVSYLSEESERLSVSIVNHICEETGFHNRGAIVRDDMSGINWCQIPVSIVEMGFMSNPEEDKKLGTEEYQNKIAKGIADGIDEYFKE